MAFEQKTGDALWSRFLSSSGLGLMVSVLIKPYVQVWVTIQADFLARWDVMLHTDEYETAWSGLVMAVITGVGLYLRKSHIATGAKADADRSAIEAGVAVADQLEWADQQIADLRAKLVAKADADAGPKELS